MYSLQNAKLPTLFALVAGFKEAALRIMKCEVPYKAVVDLIDQGQVLKRKDNPAMSVSFAYEEKELGFYGKSISNSYQWLHYYRCSTFVGFNILDGSSANQTTEFSEENARIILNTAMAK